MIQCSWNQPQGIKLGRSHFRSQSYFSTIYSKVILESKVSVLLSQDQCLDQSWISQVPFHWSSSRILLTETRTEWEGPGTRWLPGCSWRVVPPGRPAVRASRWRWSLLGSGWTLWKRAPVVFVRILQGHFKYRKYKYIYRFYGYTICINW